MRNKFKPKKLLCIWGAIIGAGEKMGEVMAAEERQNDAQEFNLSMAAGAQDFNSREANRQREWEEHMASTQYQRAVTDLNNAGLNPMLAYHQGGNKAGHGAVASTSPSSSGIASPGGGGSIMASWQAASQVELSHAAAERTRAESEKIRAEKAEIEARTPTHAVSMDVMRQNIQESQERIQKIIQETSTSAYSAQHLAQQTINLRAIIPQIEATVAQIRAQTRLHGAHIVQAETQSEKNLSEAATSRAHEDEIRQRMRQDLPALEAALRQLEAKARDLEMPRRGMDAAAHSSFLGALSAVLRALNPFATLSGAVR